MYRKIKNIVIWSFIIIYLIVSFGFISDKKAFINCKKVEINVIDQEKHKFITEEDILEIFENESMKIQGYPYDSVHTFRIEDKIRNLPQVRSAEVYSTIDGVLRIFITQKDPLVRIFNYNNDSYYIDREGWLMPCSDRYTDRVIVASGNINEPYSLRYKKNFKPVNQDKDYSVLKDIYALAEFIEADEFWEKQIQQIYINDEKEIELIPVAGDHYIILGDINNFREKLRNLRAVYEKGFSNEGWNKYSLISLKFKNQVVCTKK